MAEYRPNKNYWKELPRDTQSEKYIRVLTKSNYKLEDMEYGVSYVLQNRNEEIEIIDWIYENVECDWGWLVIVTFYPATCRFTFSDISTAALFRLRF